jgi:hypothetical protein
LNTREQWSAWARGDRHIDPAGALPSLDSVPPMQRRRFSDLSRQALWAAFDCARGISVQTVFASPHGELNRTQSLLTSLAHDEPLSPAAFSVSVHNTASGLYSIASGDRSPSTAIAAGADTLPLAVVEAAGTLRQVEQVMVVFADEPLPPPYGPAGSTPPVALALLLGRPNADAVALALGDSTASPAAEPHALSLARWLCAGSGALCLAGERRRWLWNRP